MTVKKKSPASVQEFVVTVVRESQGIKATQLAADLAEAIREGRVQGCDDPQEVIDAMIDNGEIVEIEYVLPDMNYRCKSLYLPKGCMVTASGGLAPNTPQPYDGLPTAPNFLLGRKNAWFHLHLPGIAHRPAQVDLHMDQRGGQLTISAYQHNHQLAALSVPVNHFLADHSPPSLNGKEDPLGLLGQARNLLSHEYSIQDPSAEFMVAALLSLARRQPGQSEGFRKMAMRLIETLENEETVP